MIKKSASKWLSLATITILGQPPRIYQAWIRFSNQDGSINPDIDRDIRGMVIKLMGVPGKKLQEFEEDEQTQDFILISTNVFVTKNVEEFDDLINPNIS